MDKPQGKDPLAREEVSCRNLIIAKEKTKEQEHIKTMNKSQKKIHLPGRRSVVSI